MNVLMKLTFDGLIRALRFRQAAVREDISLGRRGVQPETENSSGDRHEEWRGSIAEGTL